MQNKHEQSLLFFDQALRNLRTQTIKLVRSVGRLADHNGPLEKAVGLFDRNRFYARLRNALGGCLLRIELDDAKQRFASGRSFLRCH